LIPNAVCSDPSDGDGTDVLDKEPAGTEPHDEESVRSELTDDDSELPEAIIPPHPSILPGEWHDSFEQLVTDHPKDPGTIQSEFTIAAEPTRIGRVRKTRDMADIYACLCGNKVSQTDIDGSNAARCTYPGCETQWVSNFALADAQTNWVLCQFHLDCLNFDFVPRNWRCEVHTNTKKARR
jgi:hypothetical protein